MNDIDESKRIIALLNEDIIDLQKRKSNILNEIAGIIEIAKKKSEEIHTARMEKLESEYSKRKVKQDEAQKYLDDFMVRLDVKDRESSAKQIILDGQARAQIETVNEFEARQKSVLEQVRSDTRSNEKERNRIAKEQKLLETYGKQVSDKEAQIVESTAKMGAQETALNAKVEYNNSLIAKNEELLESISEKEKSVQCESQIIHKNLDAMQAEKQDIIKLSVIKDDIAKFEDEKTALKIERKKLQERSNQIETRETSVREKEATSSEKEKYLILREREIQGKIEILRKLRSGENA